MKVKELMLKLLEFNQEADVNVVVNNKEERFSIAWGNSEGVQKHSAEVVSLYVDRMCKNESEKT